MPTFSVLITCYNYGRYITEAVASVQAQSDEDWEIVIVDDGSTDSSWDVISEFDDERITVFRHDRNEGCPSAFNTALAAATGDIICNLDADDRYRPQFLARQREFLDTHPEVDISGTWCTAIDAAGEHVTDSDYETWFNQPVDLNDVRNWIWQNRLCHTSTAVRRTLHDRVGGHLVTMRTASDWEKWWRMLSADARFAVIPEILVENRLHGANISKQGRGPILMDWAAMTGHTVNPYLRRVGREDLLCLNLAHLLQQPEVAQMQTAELTELLRLCDAEVADTIPGLQMLSRTAIANADNAEENRLYARELESRVDEDAVTIETLRRQLADLQRQAQHLRDEVAALRSSRAFRAGQAARRWVPNRSRTQSS